MLGANSTAATLSTAHPISALQSVIAFYINYTALLTQARLVTPSRAYYLTTATMPAPFKRISDIEDMDEDE